MTMQDSPPQASPPPPPPPPSTPPPATAGPAPLRLRHYIAVAAVGAVAAASVAVPITLADDEPAPATATAPADSSDDEGEATTTDDAADAPVAAIAADVTPSVARVDVRGPAGTGSGSAVVYRSDGYLVTNNHVVEGAAQVSVTLPSGQEHEAEVVGTDPVSDLAVLRVDAEDLPVLPIAEESPAIGDTAVAVGSPFGLDGSVTAGIVSALNRTVTAQGAPIIDMVQTDAAINPGNSGGALVDGSGRLIGINTAIASSGGGSDGIGFAIPVDTVQSVADQLIETGSVAHAWIGVRGGTVDPQVAELYGLPTDEGAVIASIEEDSPAADAGLQQGDIVTALDDTPITSFEQLAAEVQTRQVGDTVTLTVLRGGEEVTLEVTLGERPTDPTQP